MTRVVGFGFHLVIGAEITGGVFVAPHSDMRQRFSGRGVADDPFDRLRRLGRELKFRSEKRGGAIESFSAAQCILSSAIGSVTT